MSETFQMSSPPKIRVHLVSAFYPSVGPIMGQRRLIMSRSAPHSVVTIRVRPSVVIRELDRIENRSRPHVGYSASEEFLSSNVSKDWEDEKRKIRADTISLMQRVQSPVPRCKSVVPYSTISRYGYNEPVYSPRITSDEYISRILLPVRNVAREINSMSWYPDPAKKFTGRGHLACIRYSGAKAFQNRKPLYQDMSVRDDVTLLSFYARNRLAAAGLALDSVTAAPELKDQPTLVECSS